MIKFIIRKTFLYLCCLLLIASFSFLLIKMVPGDPFSNDYDVPEHVLATLNQHYGLDLPIRVQYQNFMLKLLSLDLGTSIVHPGRSVLEILIQGIVVSAELGLWAFFISLTLGMSLGTLSWYYHKKSPDHWITIITSFGISIPNFVLAALLQFLLCIQFSVFPVARWETPWHKILPILSLSIFPSCHIARLIRVQLLQIWQKDFIRFAFARGLSLRVILIKYAMRLAILPVLSYLGPLFAYLLTGSFVLERVFAIPGLGQWTIMSILARDYPMILGLILFYSSILLVTMFLSDCLRAFLYPKIRERFF